MSSSQVSRRDFLKALSLGTGALVLGACASKESAIVTEAPATAASGGAQNTVVPTLAPTTAPATAPATPQPASGGVLKIATNYKPNIQNPWVRSDANITWHAATYDTLTRYDAEVVPQPRLAEKWEWAQDNTELTIHLRKGVKFHSGREMTSKDVEWNFRQIMDPENGSQLQKSLTRAVDIQLPDDYTIVLKFEKTTTNFFDTLESLNIADPETLDAIKSGQAGGGTGPFAVTKLDVDSGIVMERNASYWMKDLPHLEKIELNVVPDSEAMVMNLESQAANMIIAPNPIDLERYKTEGNYQVLLSENEAPRYVVGVNTTAEFLSDKRVRQALNWAMPRQRFSETRMLNLVDPVCLPWTKTSPAFDADQNSRYSYDLEKAKSLITEAGVPEGTLFKVVYIAENEDLAKFCVMYQQELEQLGIKIELVPTPVANYTKQLSGKEIEHIFVGYHNNHMLYPTSLLTENFPYRAGDNASQFRSETYEDLVAQASVELDPEKAKELYLQINEVLLDECFIMPFSNQAFAWVMDKGVTNLAYNKFNWMVYEDVQMS